VEDRADAQRVLQLRASQDALDEHSSAQIGLAQHAVGQVAAEEDHLLQVGAIQVVGALEPLATDDHARRKVERLARAVGQPSLMGLNQTVQILLDVFLSDGDHEAVHGSHFPSGQRWLARRILNLV